MNLSKLQFSAAPNLPLAPREWNAQYQDQFANTLRLYFTQLSSLLQNLAGTKGGYHLSFPFGAFHSNDTQTAASTTTAYSVTFDTTDYSNGVKLVDTTKFVVDRTGVYNFQFSAQLSNDDNQSQDIDMWFRKNGVDIPDSNTRFGMPAHKSAGNPSYVVAALNFIVQLNAGDYLELVWSSTDTQTLLQYSAAGSSPTRPAIPSVIASMTFVSAPLE
jgi:hypothetical protein